MYKLRAWVMILNTLLHYILYTENIFAQQVDIIDLLLILNMNDVIMIIIIINFYSHRLSNHFLK